MTGPSGCVTHEVEVTQHYVTSTYWMPQHWDDEPPPEMTWKPDTGACTSIITTRIAIMLIRITVLLVFLQM